MKTIDGDIQTKHQISQGWAELFGRLLHVPVRPIKRRLPRLSLWRNKPCFCGSGKKFKKCCIELYDTL